MRGVLCGALIAVSSAAYGFTPSMVNNLCSVHIKHSITQTQLEFVMEAKAAGWSRRQTIGVIAKVETINYSHGFGGPLVLYEAVFDQPGVDTVQQANQFLFNRCVARIEQIK